MKHEQAAQFSPPKAEATGSNPVGCTNKIKGLSRSGRGSNHPDICAATQKPLESPSKHIAPAHKAMARELGYALTLQRTYGWHFFTDQAAAKLAETERAALAFAALQSLSPELAEMTAAHALGASGSPLPPFLGGMDEARLWAACASRTEHKAFALAAFEALTPSDQAAFLHHVSQKDQAA